MRIFITGGAGYIGSHTAHLLAHAGHETIVYDNLSSGIKASLPSDSIFVEGDVTDKDKLNQSVQIHRPDAIIHFAALIEVEESISKPLKYYKNNFLGTLSVLEACEKNHIGKFIFSSTAAVYGDSSSEPMTECSMTGPINPYGHSKLMSEKLIQDFANANNFFNFVILRYFNVAGAQIEIDQRKASLKIGQFRERATHLITLAARAAVGSVSSLKVFGTDYPTPDGTCIRDYIHVDDLAAAHVRAIEYLSVGDSSDIFNCGYGSGSSVKEVIRTMKEITGTDFKVECVGRRPGDSPALVANSDKAKRKLGWAPKYNDLSLICKSAYDWEIVRKKNH